MRAKSNAVVRHLEERAGASRANLRWPEDEGHPHPVEIALVVDGNLFALEHTGIRQKRAASKSDRGGRPTYEPMIDALKNPLWHNSGF